ncbi:MAG: glutamine--tRNA ligase/YqeY domain fusion protein [Deltaproteobacteria bacterium]|jgi:glutaminyl-tRNA synthetase|nr:glutamine--tRNA ligase/YqeY domain fusion protein [Deltaproteobacteria bacterium]
MLKKNDEQNDSRPESLDFIRTIIANDVKNNKHDSWVITRFPPEPNGHLHIGHAKAICLNFGISLENTKSRCHLRFDDTNPDKEEDKYIRAIKEDVKWLGFDWGDHLYYASDYFEKMYSYAEELIQNGKAYVCSLSPDEVRNTRGTLTEPGIASPDRNRPPEESLDLFRRMKAGEFDEGKYTLRAKIDMASGNFNMRDPAIYRIKKASHPRTGNSWCIYPMYDYAHCLEDAIEEITHSLCTLEFEDHRPLYDWYLDELKTPCHPRQIEFARLNLTYTVMSKRKLLELVEEKRVDDWDDPRMPTIAGLRRRGYTPSSIRNFCDRIGIAKRDSTVDVALLEFYIRDELNKTAPRTMGVLKPLKVVIENYPDDQTEELDAINNPEDESAGTRKLPFAKVLYIERDDFMEDPPKKFFRLAPGREVRLRYAYFIKCTDVVKNPNTDEIEEIRCTYDPATKGGNAPDGRKVKATIHWVSAEHALNATVRLYDRLFNKENPLDGADYHNNLNSDSLQIIADAKLEPSLKSAKAESRYQFERLGYFFVDPKDSEDGKPVFNRIVTLRDAWQRIQKSGK